MGWKNSNLRTEMTRLLRCAGVSGWPRLFHALKLQEGRASRQTELQREFPLHVVCSRLGNSPRIAQQSYLLVSEPQRIHASGDQDQSDHRGAREGVSREAQSQRDGHDDDPQTDPIRETVHARRGRLENHRREPIP